MFELSVKNGIHQFEKGLSYTWNESANAVLNGIAYYPPNDSFIITGKLWDLCFEVKLDYWEQMKAHKDKALFIKTIGSLLSTLMVVSYFYG